MARTPRPSATEADTTTDRAVADRLSADEATAERTTAERRPAGRAEGTGAGEHTTADAATTERTSAERSSADRLSAHERRAALLDVARPLVAEVGPGAVTIGRVAEAAGVTRALVYKHFANKDDLLEALYRREARGLDHRMRVQVEAAPDGFEAKLRAFIGVTLDAAEEHFPFFTPLRQAGAATPNARGDQRDRDRRTVDYFARLAVDAYGLDLRTARSVIAVLFTGIRSLLSQMRSRPGPAQRAFLLDTYVDMTLGALERLAEPKPDANAKQPPRA